MKWRAGKMQPKKYGEHLDVGAGLDGGVKITFTNAEDPPLAKGS